MKTELNISELILGLEIFRETDRERLLHLIRQQIEKDLHLAGISFQIHEDSISDVYWMKLANLLFNIMNEEPEKFAAFLYRVDLAETVIFEKVTKSIAHKTESLLKAIVRREGEKVISRMNLSQGT